MSSRKHKCRAVADGRQAPAGSPCRRMAVCSWWLSLPPPLCCLSFCIFDACRAALWHMLLAMRVAMCLPASRAEALLDILVCSAVFQATRRCRMYLSPLVRVLSFFSLTFSHASIPARAFMCASFVVFVAMTRRRSVMTWLSRASSPTSPPPCVVDVFPGVRVSGSMC